MVIGGPSYSENPFNGWEVTFQIHTQIAFCIQTYIFFDTLLLHLKQRKLLLANYISNFHSFRMLFS